MTKDQPIMTKPEHRTLGKLPDAAFGCLDLPSIDARTIRAFQALPDLTGMVCDALDLHGLNGAVSARELVPTLPARRIVGPALTVLNRKRTDEVATAVKNHDNRLGDIEAHNLARAGNVLVVQGVEGVSSMGGIAAARAVRQGEAAIIVDGAVRDLESSRALGLPIWARDVTPLTGKWRLETIGINVEVSICGIKVHPGDLVVADETGVCFVPHNAIDAVLATAQAIAQDEDRRQKLISAGTPTGPASEEQRLNTMIVDHRTYTIPHGRMKEYLRRYEATGLALQRRYLGHYIGCYVSEIGPLNQVTHLWGFASMADREERRARLEQDPEWMAFREANVGSFTAQETKILRATSFSPQPIFPESATTTASKWTPENEAAM